jgi:NTP pyrophosphatase (non-canonical NTP hydrolase)
VEEDITPRPVVLAFARAMERKLRQNDHKPGWEGDGIGSLLWRLNEERLELHAAIDNHTIADPFQDIGGGDRIVLDSGEEPASEAVDVANFAMMLWDRFVGNLGSGREPR